ADAKTQARLRFAVEQWMAASAPSNYLAFNAEAQQKAVESKGESIARGMQNLMHDMRQGHVSMTDESAFEVGRNVATTEGAVVFENDYFQLIEYKPLTPKVYERPFLMVPPCINKYYILDLQPENSLIRHAVAEGHRTFVVSWRNPDASLAQSTWDDYIEQAVITAIHTVQDISGAEQINALGFCVGGTMLSNALAVLAARGEDAVASATFLTTLIDFSDTGILDVFIDEAFVKFREMQMGQGGMMKGQDLASTFSFLRPNDLVWNYVVGNYLKGETPPPFDLLYWNSDATNLPGPYYAWYLRNFYLENNLVQPGKLTVCGEAIDLNLVDVPTYIYGSREDHIVPIGAAYASTQVLPGPKRFVMG
ncbi:MAG: alpha/beta fold hydrolase, partial [Comamonadaceae bacterium]